MKAVWTSKLEDIAKSQIAFAAANALNDTAKSAADDARTEAGKLMNIRRKNLLRVFIRPPTEHKATKRKLTARVVVAGPKSDPSRGPVLASHEEPGIKTPNRGQYVAMPGREIRTGKGGHVKPGFALKNFKPFLRAGARKSYGQKRTWIVRSKKTGTPMLMQAVGKRVRVLWLFVERTRLLARLGFRKSVAKTVQRDFDNHMRTRMSQAIASAKTITRGGGVQSTRL